MGRVEPGSSPLARGLRGYHTVNLNHRRIIPARAGFTRMTSRALAWGWDHPRSRGVYLLKYEAPRTPIGSSPLARGLHRSEAVYVGRRGIIPARAGFTVMALAAVVLAVDHPRSRGVYAGDHLRLAAHFPDHPRSRGVYADSASSDTGHSGSSPLARGLRPHSRRRPGSPGIIPARAGFTRGGLLAGRPPRDHPRSRGVYLPRCGGRRLCRWIIPARAGFTRARLGRSARPRDHPRSRGVYTRGTGPG